MFGLAGVALPFYFARMESSGAPQKPLYDQIFAEIAKIEDPELGISITELGLIYDVQVTADGKVDVVMTFTSMACPVGPQLKAQVHAAATRVEGVSDANVEVVFNPPWDPHEMASEDARMYLGIV